MKKYLLLSFMFILVSGMNTVAMKPNSNNSINLDLFGEEILIPRELSQWTEEELVERFLEIEDHLGFDAACKILLAVEPNFLVRVKEPGLVKIIDRFFKQPKSCELCLEDKTVGDFKRLSCCNYNVSCTDCLLELINSSLQEKTVGHINCPNRKCAKKIEEKDIRVITHNHPELHKVFCDIATDELLNKDSNIKQCPTPNCSFRFENKQTLKQAFTCPQCKQWYCSACLVRHAPEMTCEEARAHAELIGDKTNIDKANEEWLQKNTKACPNCKIVVQKNGGCNHMTCKKCHHEFCWTCGAAYRTTTCNSFHCARANAEVPFGQPAQGQANGMNELPQEIIDLIRHRLNPNPRNNNQANRPFIFIRPLIIDVEPNENLVNNNQGAQVNHPGIFIGQSLNRDLPIANLNVSNSAPVYISTPLQLPTVSETRRERAEDQLRRQEQSVNNNNSMSPFGIAVHDQDERTAYYIRTLLDTGANLNPTNNNQVNNNDFLLRAQQLLNQLPPMVNQLNNNNAYDERRSNVNTNQNTVFIDDEGRAGYHGYQEDLENNRLETLPFEVQYERSNSYLLGLQARQQLEDAQRRQQKPVRFQPGRPLDQVHFAEYEQQQEQVNNNNNNTHNEQQQPQLNAQPVTFHYDAPQEDRQYGLIAEDPLLRDQLPMFDPMPLARRLQQELRDTYERVQRDLAERERQEAVNAQTTNINNNVSDEAQRQLNFDFNVD